MFSLREAAREAGTSKSTILRAIQSGRLSANRTDEGGYAIDPAELFRVYPPKKDDVAAERSTDRATGQDAPANATGATAAELAEKAELSAKLAAAEAKLLSMQEMLEEVKQSRDDWRSQVKSMTALLPKPAEPEPHKPWWKRLAG